MKAKEIIESLGEGKSVKVNLVLLGQQIAIVNAERGDVLKVYKVKENIWDTINKDAISKNWESQNRATFKFAKF